MGTSHSLSLERLHRVARSTQDPDLGAICDDLQLLENYANEDAATSDEEAREAVERISGLVTEIFDLERVEED